MRRRNRVIGSCILAFGGGILISAVLPATVVIFVEAAVIIAAGFCLLGGIG